MLKTRVTAREIIMFGVCLVLSYFAFVKKWDNVTLNEKNIRAEERIKMLEADKKTQHFISDSLATEIQVTKGIIEYQKANPKLIIEKYDKVRDNIAGLNADSTVLFYADRLSKEGSHR